MGKDVLHISYDFTKENIIVQMISGGNRDIITSAWRDILLSLRNDAKFKRISQDFDVVIEYDNIIVKIDNYGYCAQAEMIVNQYINWVINHELKKKFNVIKNNNKEILTSKVSNNVSNNDKSLYSDLRGILDNRKDLSTLPTHFEPKKQEMPIVSVKVKRKNKYGKAVVITGALVLTFLTLQKCANEKSNQEDYGYTNVTNVENSIDDEITLPMNEEYDFVSNLDINDVVKTTASDLNEEIIKLNYDDRSSDAKVIVTERMYGDLIEKYAKKTGIDPKIVLGIATQESGNHDYGLEHGSKGGLMQIEIDYWRNQEITYYDFDDKETYTIKIDDDSINDVENNLLIGCAILQNELKMFNYNILLGIQSYNQGYSNMNKILDETSLRTGINKTDIINDDSCLDWLKYTSVSGQGDADYVNHVLSWTGYGYNFYELKCKDSNENIKEISTIPMNNENAKVK